MDPKKHLSNEQEGLRLFKVYGGLMLPINMQWIPIFVVYYGGIPMNISPKYGKLVFF